MVNIQDDFEQNQLFKETTLITDKKKEKKDEETKKLDTQIQEVHELIRCKIADLDTDKLALYSQLLGFSLELSKKQDVALADVDSLISQVDND